MFSCGVRYFGPELFKKRNVKQADRPALSRSWRRLWCLPREHNKRIHWEQVRFDAPPSRRRDIPATVPRSLAPLPRGETRNIALFLRSLLCRCGSGMKFTGRTKRLPCVCARASSVFSPITVGLGGEPHTCHAAHRIVFVVRAPKCNSVLGMISRRGYFIRRDALSRYFRLRLRSRSRWLVFPDRFLYCLTFRYGDQIIIKKSGGMKGEKGMFRNLSVFERVISLNIIHC